MLLENQGQWNDILQVVKNLKKKGGDFTRIYERKDVHQETRREMTRLRTRENEERQKPDNQGVEIAYDWQWQVLLCDGVIDRQLEICIWNIGGLKNKLQSPEVLYFALEFDIMWIIEI